MKQNIAVLFGGISTEHDISIITGVQTICALNAYLYNIIPIYFDKNGGVYTSSKYFDISNFNGKNIRGKRVVFGQNNSCIYIGALGRKVHIDCAIVCMHGLNGEDGMASAILQFSGIACANSDMFASVVGCDKVMFKDMLRAMHIRCVPSVSISSQDIQSNTESVVSKVVSTLGMPVIIKPARLGSSIGIKVCKSQENLLNDIKYALKFDNKVLIEQFLDDFSELNIAVYNNGDLCMSDIEEPIRSDDVLSFDNKYIAGSGMKGGQRTTPILSAQTVNYIHRISRRVYTHMAAKGVVRFDYIVSGGKVYLNEVNTVPGSMAYYLFDKSFAEQLHEQIDYAIQAKNREKHLVRYFESSVLKSRNGAKLIK